MMLGFLRIAAWPLVVKVPVLVAGLMINHRPYDPADRALAVGPGPGAQSRTRGYLDGVSAAVMPAIVRGDVWEAFDALDGARRNPYAGVDSRFIIVELPDGTVLAASDPLRFPVHSAVPEELRGRFARDNDLLIDTSAGHARIARTLRTEGFSLGRLFAEIDIADLLRDRREVLLTVALVNGCLTLVFALGGYFVLKRMLQPLGVLER
jgi:hypothetical protein